MFTDQSVLLRELCNGIMCISALILVGIFVHYIYRRWRRDHDAMKDVAVWAAVAFVVLMTGHAIRAFSGWMQFFWLRMEWDANVWMNGVELFLAATALIITAKILMVYTFAPYRWGSRLALLAATFAVLIPVSVVVVTW